MAFQDPSKRPLVPKVFPAEGLSHNCDSTCDVAGAGERGADQRGDSGRRPRSLGSFQRQGGARIVGAGRFELVYRERAIALEERLHEREFELARVRRELEMALLLERGAGRRLDRLEARLAMEQREGEAGVAALGEMLLENVTLRERLLATERRHSRIPI